jgi:hypothetical protein
MINYRTWQIAMCGNSFVGWGLAPTAKPSLRKLTIVNDTQSGGKSSVIVMKVPTPVGAEDHFGPWAGVGTGPLYDKVNAKN